MTTDPSPAGRLGLLVFGMHRSGTSALTGVLERLGVPVPGDLLPPAADNPTGFFENRAVYEFGDQLLEALGSRWDDPMPVGDGYLRSPLGAGLVSKLERLIRSEFLAGGSFFAVKEPRMSRFVPLWREALSRADVDARAVLVLRHPVEVAASLTRRDRFSRAKGLLLWLEYALAAERDTRDMPRSFVRYDAVLADWRSEVDRLAAELDLRWPRDRAHAERDVDSFLSADLRHHAAPAAIGDATRLDALVSRAWDALARLAERRDDATATADLDTIRAEAEAAAAVLGPYLAAELLPLRDALVEATAAKLTADHHLNLERIERTQILDAERQKLDAERAQLVRAFEEERARFDRTMEEQRLHRAEAERRLRDLLKESRATAVRAEKQLRAATNELDHLRSLPAEIARLRPFEAAAAEVGPLREVIDHQGRIVADLQAAYRDLSSSFNAIQGSTLWRATRVLVRAAAALPPSLRRTLRGSAAMGWRFVTPWRAPARRQVAAARAALAASMPGIAVPASEASSASVESVASEEVPTRPPVTGDLVQATYPEWVRQHDQLTAADLDAMRRHIETFRQRTTFSVVVPLYNTPELTLREMIASVIDQVYPHWELCLADDASKLPHVRAVLEEFAALDPRIKVVFRTENGHISAATNTALGSATGDYVALLDHDDLLAPQALYEAAAAIDADPDLDILYSDEDKIDDSGDRFDIYFKPSFSLDLLLGQNVISHLGIYRRNLIEEIGGLRLGFEGSQDYDLALRAVAATQPARIRHIPEVLYHWRQEWGGGSFSQTQLERCTSAGRAAIQEQLDAGRFSGRGGKVIAAPLVPSWNRVVWDMPADLPMVDVVIPTRDHVDLLRDCLRGLLERTSYRKLRVTIVDNGSEEEETLAFLRSIEAQHETVSVLRDAGPFNYSRLNNEAVARTDGEVVLLLNNDIDILHHDWLDELVRQVMRPDIGAVGAKLLYPDGTVQHAGVRLGAGQFDGDTGVAGHVGLRRPGHDVGYLGHLALARDVGAVTAACLAVRREVWNEVGGLDEENLAVAFNDVDFCLRVREAGYRILWTPFAELTHRESASRGSDMSPEKAARFRRECEYMVRRWRKALKYDPFYSHHFDNTHEDWAVSFETRDRTWSHMM